MVVVDRRKIMFSSYFIQQKAKAGKHALFDELNEREKVEDDDDGAVLVHAVAFFSFILSLTIQLE